MFRNVAQLAVLFAACFTSEALAAWNASSTLPTSNLERRLIEDCRDGALDSHSLLTASLIAGGENDAAVIEADEAKFRAAAASLLRTAEPQKLGMDGRRESVMTHRSDANLGGDRSACMETHGRRVLKALHEHMLIGQYRADCSNLHETIRRGDYNCVTATIAYQILCASQGVGTHAVAVPAHVFSRLDECAMDVQTTCSTWLGPGKGRHSSVETDDRRSLNEVQLLGKVYYNRGVIALHASDFDEAVRVLRISLVLDPGDMIAKNNLLAAINNWSLDESSRGRFASASELLTIGQAIDADYAPLRANDLHVHQRWVQRLCRARRFSFAMGILEDGLRRRPDAKLFDSGRYVVLRLWAGDIWVNGGVSEGFEIFKQPWDAKKLDEAMTVAAIDAATTLSAQAKYANALELVRTARRRVDDARLVEIHQKLESLAP